MADNRALKYLAVPLVLLGADLALAQALPPKPGTVAVNMCYRFCKFVALLEIEVTPWPDKGTARVVKRYKGLLPGRYIALQRIQAFYESPEQLLARAPKAGRRYFACLDRVTQPLRGDPKLSGKPLYQLQEWHLVETDTDLELYGFVVKTVKDIDRARSARVQVGAIRSLLRDPRPLVQQAGVSEYKGAGIGGPRRLVIQDALFGELVRLMSAESEASVAIATLLESLARVDATLSRYKGSSAEQRAQSVEHRLWADGAVALLAHPSATARFNAAAYLATDRTKLESGRQYSMTGTPGGWQDMEAFCRARQDRRLECRLDWWLTVEKEAITRWRAWHAGGGHLRAVVPAK
jgi:hypothetical protein